MARTNTKAEQKRYRAVRAFWANDNGTPRFVAEGAVSKRIIGSELNWIDGDADDAEAADAKMALEEESFSRTYREPQPAPVPEKPKVRCVKTFYDMGVPILEGDEYFADAQIVLDTPGAFEPV